MSGNSFFTSLSVRTAATDLFTIDLDVEEVDFCTVEFRLDILEFMILSSLDKCPKYALRIHEKLY